ncbi:MAG: serine dehydratase [Ignavibacteriae bacterium HGW-Ignavibacteriae-4]|jgi:threonine dehydratase|nr:MAG: serine dehydratase [Ignavibacteriae bacterium HGW-Ignavibacteriae-4]
MPITISDITKAYERIAHKVHRTPVLSCSQINEIVGANLYFKCENFQKVGAFKYRGATNALLSLPKEKLAKGVTTHSSGNHAQALALAARELGVPSYIIMPSNSPKVKIDAVRGYGAEITFCEPNLQARESTLERKVSETGAEFIHPYNREEIIAGQGTAALELLTDYPELDVIIAPVGGGGLLSGTAICSKGTNPDIKVYAAEPKGADDAYRSFCSGALVPSNNPKTICDGLLTSLGDLNYGYIKKYVDDILLVDDTEIIAAMKLIYERMKIIVEPSSATVLAATIKYKELFADKSIGLIISGGNVDMQVFFDSYYAKLS